MFVCVCLCVCVCVCVYFPSLSTLYRALLIEHRALLTVYRALLTDFGHICILVRGSRRNKKRRS